LKLLIIAASIGPPLSDKSSRDFTDKLWFRMSYLCKYALNPTDWVCYKMAYKSCSSRLCSKMGPN
jgi:hypothetical protein